MRRVIVDYKRLDREIAALLIEMYPHGYGDEDIIVLKKPNGELIEAVEIKTTDTIYLVKISQSLSNFISSFDESMEKELEVSNEDSATSETASDSNIEIEPDFRPSADDLL